MTRLRVVAVLVGVMLLGPLVHADDRSLIGRLLPADDTVGLTIDSAGKLVAGAGWKVQRNGNFTSAFNATSVTSVNLREDSRGQVTSVAVAQAESYGPNKAGIDRADRVRFIKMNQNKIAYVANCEVYPSLDMSLNGGNAGSAECAVVNDKVCETFYQATGIRSASEAIANLAICKKIEQIGDAAVSGTLNEQAERISGEILNQSLSLKDSLGGGLAEVAKTTRGGQQFRINPVGPFPKNKVLKKPVEDNSEPGVRLNLEELISICEVLDKPKAPSNPNGGVAPASRKRVQ